MSDTTRFEGTLFFAGMVEMSWWMKNPSMAQMWEQKYQDEVSKLTRESRRGRRDDQNQPGASHDENVFKGV